MVAVGLALPRVALSVSEEGVALSEGAEAGSVTVIESLISTRLRSLPEPLCTATYTSVYVPAALLVASTLMDIVPPVYSSHPEVDTEAIFELALYTILDERFDPVMVTFCAAETLPFSTVKLRVVLEAFSVGLATVKFII